MNGHPEERLPNTLNLSFAWVNGQALLMNLRGVAVSSGSACTSADAGPSYVLTAMGVEEELAQASLRFGLGRWTTEEEVSRAADEVVAVVARLRESSPDYALHRHGLART
jgi:cysteine desulfurase